MSAVQQNLQEKNKVYAEGFTQGHLALPPAKKYAVVTCMDARIDPISAFGIDLGDAHVIRNAGGSAREAIRSLVISEQLLKTEEVVVVKHTGCGMLTFTNEQAQSILTDSLGEAAVKELSTSLGSLDLLPFPELDQAVKDDLSYLKGSKLIPDTVKLSGWVYEVETGKVRRVD